MTASTVPSSRLTPGLLGIWLGVAIVAGATGAVAALPFPVPQVVLLLLAVLSVIAGTRQGPVRAWVDALPLNAIVGVHVLRAVAGVTFLLLAAGGGMSPLFAYRAGIGDIVAAVLAVVAIAVGRRGLYLAWNTIGLLDFAIVLYTAAFVAGQGSVPGVAPLLRLPLSLLPTFVVPLLIASHVFVYRRLLRD